MRNGFVLLLAVTIAASPFVSRAQSQLRSHVDLQPGVTSTSTPATNSQISTPQRESRTSEVHKAAGAFSFTVEGSESLKGSPEDILSAHAMLTNTSTEDVRIDIIRRINDIPELWATSVCLDVCLPDFIDSTSLFLSPGTSQEFSLYFYTSAVPGVGTVHMEFINAEDFTNQFTQEFTASTVSVDGIATLQSPSTSQLDIYPNPAPVGSDLGVQLGAGMPGTHSTAVLVSVAGKVVRRIEVDPGREFQIGTSGLAPGAYMLLLDSGLRTPLQTGVILY